MPYYYFHTSVMPEMKREIGSLTKVNEKFFSSLGRNIAEILLIILLREEVVAMRHEKSQ